MTPAQAKRAAAQAVKRMGPLMRPGYRAHELTTTLVYAPYIPLMMTPNLVSDETVRFVQRRIRLRSINANFFKHVKIEG